MIASFYSLLLVRDPRFGHLPICLISPTSPGFIRKRAICFRNLASELPIRRLISMDENVESCHVEHCKLLLASIYTRAILNVVAAIRAVYKNHHNKRTESEKKLPKMLRTLVQKSRPGRSSLLLRGYASQTPQVSISRQLLLLLPFPPHS
jgi:hypothetical protein